jgi:hypothetical protein
MTLVSAFGNIAGSTFSAAGSARSGTRVLTPITLTTTGGITITGPLRAGTG